MEAHERQGQHRIPKVYLKQFGFPIENPCWISVLGKDTGRVRQVLIENFTVETNVFDLPFKQYKIRRHFENISGTLESSYNRIVATIHNQKQLLEKDKMLLGHFVANLLCRAKPFRFFLDGLLTHSQMSKDKLIYEICFFKQLRFSGMFEGTKKMLNNLPKEQQLNVVMCLAADYLGKALQNFNFVIIKACKNKMWFTTDNPVYLIKNNNYNTLVSAESEIYFPLSKDYCLFMYCKEGEIKSNPLRKLQVDRINVIDDLTFGNLVNEINLNSSEYLISPIELFEYDLPLKNEANI